MAGFPRPVNPEKPDAEREATRHVLFPDYDTGIHPDEVTLAELLKGQGYATGCVGKWHLGDRKPYLPLQNGFDYYYGIPYSNDMVPTPLMRNNEVIEEPADQDSLTERYTREAVRFIEDHKEEPFFLYVPHSMPHIPLHVSDRFWGQSERGLYGDVIEMIDWSTGEILDAIREAGLAENTLVIYTSDNGPWLSHKENGGEAHPLRAGKGSCYEGGMRVPTVAWWPGTIPAGKDSDALMGTIDLLPTFANLAGAEAPSDRVIDGGDIMPLLRGEKGAKSPHEAYYYFKRWGLEAVRSGDWKLMFERKKWEEFPYRRKYYDDPMADVGPALYNLREDIGETTNVIADHPEVAARLRGYAEDMVADLGCERLGVEGPGRRPLGGFGVPENP
jgi:arylsulfatase A-like enzyme